MPKITNYKYTGVENGKQLRHLSRMILKAYYSNELILIVIHGKQGYGKSTYAAICLAQVYGAVNKINELTKHELPDEYSEKDKRKIELRFLNELFEGKHDFEYDWQTTKKYFVFKPRSFLTTSRKNKTKKPACIVDDAGLWLNSMDYHSPEVKAVGKILEVARTIWGAIIFTCSDQQQIFGKLRNMPHVFTIRISKYPRGGGYEDRRIARIFKGWVSEDLKKHGRKTIAYDVYYAEMPGDLRDPHSFYGWYVPERKKLTSSGFNELEKALNKLGIE